MDTTSMSGQFLRAKSNSGRSKSSGLGRNRCAILAVVFGLTMFFSAPQAKACAVYNPICWVETAIDRFHDYLEEVAGLVMDVLTLDFEGLFDDVVDIIENHFCDGISVLNLAGGNITESMFNDCAAYQNIEPTVLAKLESYFRSNFDDVRIHTDCTFPERRTAITFGENIYFAPGKYHPLCSLGSPGACDCRDGLDNDGLAILAHELIHVLQYRREGFSDFICQYTIECGLGPEISGTVGVSCAKEQKAYIYQALVLEDRKRDGDGIFTCPLGECDDGVGEWNPNNVGLHSCEAEIGRCGLQAGDPSAPDYCEANDNCPDVYNPDQVDSDNDGRGDACDLCNSTLLPYEDLDDDCIPDVSDNCSCPTAVVDALTDCDLSNDSGFILPPAAGFCFGVSGCVQYANPDQADFDGDGLGDACDPDDDNDGLTDIIETTGANRTDPLDADSDDDGLMDGQEDANHNGALDAGETDPNDTDSDDDGLTDGCEVNGGNPTNPLDADSDDDGLTDGTEDANPNCALDPGETNPNDPDSDHDKLNDGIEVANDTDPLDADSDDDGVIDGEDVEFLQNAIRSLPRSAFRDADNGLRKSMFAILDGIEGRVARGQIARAIKDLQTLRRVVDGCGVVADVNDWIVDCAAQTVIRELIDLLITNLSSK